jgi:hypothetical protein
VGSCICAWCVVGPLLGPQNPEVTGFSLVTDGNTMDTLAGNDATTELLVEVKGETEWARGPDPSEVTSLPEDEPPGADTELEVAPEDDVAWRAWLTVRGRVNRGPPSLVAVLGHALHVLGVSMCSWVGWWLLLLWWCVAWDDRLGSSATQRIRFPTGSRALCGKMTAPISRCTSWAGRKSGTFGWPGHPPSSSGTTARSPTGASFVPTTSLRCARTASGTLGRWRRWTGAASVCCCAQ